MGGQIDNEFNVARVDSLFHSRPAFTDFFRSAKWPLFNIAGLNDVPFSLFCCAKEFRVFLDKRKKFLRNFEDEMKVS